MKIKPHLYIRKIYALTYARANACTNSYTNRYVCTQIAIKDYPIHFYVARLSACLCMA